ncbi:hypothetical protein CFC21_036293 [Triticum aestivum]|uniref:Uncharacterized protein n=2 Tax=Triticum aestivum TaxID=4565 RepID=A0A3B6EN37_WHEAT|nr:hypothetical protein CFC21_036293 [Triticum aestivum]
MDDPPSPPTTSTGELMMAESLINTGFSNRRMAIPQHSFMLVVVTLSESLNLRAAIGATKLASTLVSLDGAMVITFYIGVVFSFIQVTVQRNLAG